VVTNGGGYYSAYAYLSEARRWDIRVLLPDINKSGFGYRGFKDKILIGFLQLQNLQQKSVEALLQERKQGEFTSLDDFLCRVDIPFGDTRIFIKAGCFDRIEPEMTRPEMIYHAMEHEYRKSAAGQADKMQVSETKQPAFRDLSHRDKVRMELEVFGFPVSEHPLDKYRWYTSGRTIKGEDISKHVGKVVNMAGINITRKAIRTKHGERMEFLTFEDQTAIYECVLFPDTYEQYNDLVRWEQIFVLRGLVESAYGVCTLTIQKMASIERSIEKWKKLHPEKARELQHDQRAHGEKFRDGTVYE
jgi:error-prone DNA polymerase